MHPECGMGRFLPIPLDTRLIDQIYVPCDVMYIESFPKRSPTLLFLFQPCQMRASHEPLQPLALQRQGCDRYASGPTRGWHAIEVRRISSECRLILRSLRRLTSSLTKCRCKVGNRSVYRAMPEQRRWRILPFGMRRIQDSFIPMKLLSGVWLYPTQCLRHFMLWVPELLRSNI